jgi:hypothetical protein
MTNKHHRVNENWMGKSVETLEDLLRPGLRAICIGINPAPTSVTRGHYYQGRLGQLFYQRLRRAGFFPTLTAGKTILPSSVASASPTS